MAASGGTWVKRGGGGGGGANKMVFVAKGGVLMGARSRAAAAKPAGGTSSALRGAAAITVGVGQAGLSLHGVPLTSAQRGFWKGQADAQLAGETWPPSGKAHATGCVIVEPDGRMWVVEPTGHYGGYQHTFPKGKIEKGLTDQQNALKEAFEESGLQVKITGVLGHFEGDTSITRYYIAQRVGGNPADHHWETQNVKLVTPEAAKGLLNKQRDQDVLSTLQGHVKMANVPKAPAPAPAEVLPSALAAKPVGTITQSPAGYHVTLPNGQNQVYSSLALAKNASKQVLKASTAVTAQTTKIAQAQAGIVGKPAAATAIIDQPTQTQVKPLVAATGTARFPGLAGVSTVKGLGGSTGAKLVVDAAGNQYVQKQGKSPQHLLEESYADAGYQALGANVPKFKVYQTASGPVKLAQFVKGQVLSDLSGAQREAAHAQLRRHFTADALLANWDVIGLNADNIIVSGGKAFRIDNGGSLRFRAQGAIKAGFGPIPTEIFTMRTSPQGKPVFGGLGIAEIAAQAKGMAGKRASFLATMPSDLQGVMGKRFDRLQQMARAHTVLSGHGASSAQIEGFVRKIWEAKQDPKTDAEILKLYGGA